MILASAIGVHCCNAIPSASRIGAREHRAIAEICHAGDRVAATLPLSPTTTDLEHVLRALEGKDSRFPTTQSTRFSMVGRIGHHLPRPGVASGIPLPITIAHAGRVAEGSVFLVLQFDCQGGRGSDTQAAI